MTMDRIEGTHTMGRRGEQHPVKSVCYIVIEGYEIGHIRVDYARGSAKFPVGHGVLAFGHCAWKGYMGR